MEPIPLILDVDTGVDDALAVLYALASPEVTLIAATTVMGNVDVDHTTENTLAVLELCGYATWRSRKVPDGRSSATAWRSRTCTGRAVSARRAAARVSRPPTATARLLVETARERPGEVMLVATGPLTNVALALRSRRPRPAQGLAIMGGAFDHQGNVTPAAEANIWSIPRPHRPCSAGRWRAGSEAPRGVGLDVTERVKLDRDGVNEMCAAAPDSTLAAFLQGSVPFYIEFYERYGSSDGASMHDPLALAIAIDPSLATLQTTRVEVETDGTWTRGATVTDLRGIRAARGDGWMPEDNARVAIDVTRPRSWRASSPPRRSSSTKGRMRVEGRRSSQSSARLNVISSPQVPSCQGWDRRSRVDVCSAPRRKGGNQAVATRGRSRGVRRRAPGRPPDAGAVGDDQLVAALEALRANDVHTDHVVVNPEAPTGVALIAVGMDGENQISVAPGANASLEPSDVVAALETLRPHLLLVSLEVSERTARAALEWARDHDVTTILNPAPPQRWTNGVLGLATYVTQ
jgi:purine nucleosidase